MVRIAVTQTRNAFSAMPDRREDLPRLADRLDDIRVANLDHHAELVALAAAAGVQAIGFGELFPGLYFALTADPMWHAMAEDSNSGPSVIRCQELARQHQMVIVAPIYELDADRRFNTAVVIDADGSHLGRYRKTHIPSGRNEIAGFCEDFYYGRGDEADPFPVFQTRIGTIGVSICYDRHFEGVVRSLREAGASLIFAPAVTFGEQSRRMWSMEFAVDALRHNVVIAGSNRVGQEPPWNIEYFGESHIVGPHGVYPNRSETPGLVIADVDLKALSDDHSSGWNLGRDRRPDDYR